MYTRVPSLLASGWNHRWVPHRARISTCTRCRGSLLLEL